MNKGWKLLVQNYAAFSAWNKMRHDAVERHSAEHLFYTQNHFLPLWWVLSGRVSLRWESWRQRYNWNLPEKIDGVSNLGQGQVGKGDDAKVELLQSLKKTNTS